MRVELVELRGHLVQLTMVLWPRFQLGGMMVDQAVQPAAVGRDRRNVSDVSQSADPDRETHQDISDGGRVAVLQRAIELAEDVVEPERRQGSCHQGTHHPGLSSACQLLSHGGPTRGDRRFSGC